MVLTAAGVGRDAAFGTVNYSFDGNIKSLPTEEQKRWLAAFQIIEEVRMGNQDDISEEAWQVMKFDENAQLKLRDTVKTLVRRGHGWQWMM